MYGIVHDNEISLLELSPEQEQIYKLFYYLFSDIYF